MCVFPAQGYDILVLTDIYQSKRPGKLSDTPTLAKSPRKRKAETDEDDKGISQPRRTATTQEGLIRQQEVEVPHREYFPLNRGSVSLTMLY
jgi:hypothetical protein